MFVKMIYNFLLTVKIWFKEKPDYVITTGTMVAYPFYLFTILFKKKFVFIETFGRANMPTVAGKRMEKHSYLFIVLWESPKNTIKKRFMAEAYIKIFVAVGSMPYLFKRLLLKLNELIDQGLKMVMFSSKDTGANSCLFMREYAKLGEVGDPYRDGHIFFKYLVDYAKKQNW